MIHSGSDRDKLDKTPKQNKWRNGAYFNKQINTMFKQGMKLGKAERVARKRRGF